MASHQYSLGPAKYLDQLFPEPKWADPSLHFKHVTDVIRHYTINSLHADGINDVHKVEVTSTGHDYHVHIEAGASHPELVTFGERHALIFGPDYAQKAIRGMELLKQLGVWNPMENYHVNASPTDGTSKWALFPPLGLNVMGQKGLLLLHYPPWAVLQLARLIMPSP
jgi:hypothetical protein